MLKTNLNSTRSELQTADSNFQKSLSDVNTTLKTRVSLSIYLCVCVFFKFILLDGAIACLMFVYLFCFFATVFFRKLLTKNTQLPDFQLSFLELKKGCWTTVEREPGTELNELVERYVPINMIRVCGPNLSLYWETSNAKTRITNYSYILWRDINPGTQADPFDYLSHHRYMETYPPSACTTFDQSSILVYLLFQIDNLDSDTNQLSSILGAARSNLDKLNSTLVNNTLEVGLGMTKNCRNLLMVARSRTYLLVLNHAFDKKFLTDHLNFKFKPHDMKIA